LERRLLQISVAIAGLVPVTGGVAGVIWGPSALGEEALGPFDKFGLLTLIVVAGGFSRALGMLIAGPPGMVMSAALVMELVITPLLYLWQSRVQRLATLAPVDAALARS
jgi:hypothetical protein